MRKTFLRLGSFFLMIAVTLGAFGAHQLKGMLTPAQINTFETGIRYHFIHGIAILIAGILLYVRKTNALKWSGWLFAAGIICFSGSLYLLAIQEAFALSVSWLGPVTPIGGLFFVMGWAMMLVSTYQTNGKLARQASDQES
ncbi:MAG TPA: DUF423 domain-containing protein [Saprospiraceae bacterium]|nr:DUF423 domain-containing protein [Saprospiraceae bacterium]HMQ84765.1 DUF423 domain-containing protein [Saprospiraceae bacterium]